MRKSIEYISRKLNKHIITRQKGYTNIKYDKIIIYNVLIRIVRSNFTTHEKCDHTRMRLLIQYTILFDEHVIQQPLKIPEQDINTSLI